MSIDLGDHAHLLRAPWCIVKWGEYLTGWYVVFHFLVKGQH